jgi:hypothetical protein
VKERSDNDAPITVSLETLAGHILQTPRTELAALRAAFERQIASIEARMAASTHQPAIDATVKIIADVISDNVERAQQRAESDVTQALAVNAMLRKALDNAQQQLQSAEAELAAADADRKTLASQQRDAVHDKKKLAAALEKSLAQLSEVQAQLKRSQLETEELAGERLELQRKLKDATTAKAVAETQYKQLVEASQKLTDGLSRTLQGQRDQARPVAAVPPTRRVEPAEIKVEPKPPRPAAVAPPPKSSAPKKPLQFSGQARDAKRVKIRSGTHITVDGIPGELVDLSVGGAQAVVRQMVKPNQIARLVLPTAAGQLICKGRIVWVLYEQPGTSLSVYRFGVKFTDVEDKAVEDYMQDFREEHLALSGQSSEIA